MPRILPSPFAGAGSSPAKSTTIHITIITLVQTFTKLVSVMAFCGSILVVETRNGQKVEGCGARAILSRRAVELSGGCGFGAASGRDTPDVGVGSAMQRLEGGGRTKPKLEVKTRAASSMQRTGKGVVKIGMRRRKQRIRIGASDMPREDIHEE